MALRVKYEVRFIGYLDQFSEVILAVMGFLLSFWRRRLNGQILDLLGFAEGKNFTQKSLKQLVARLFLVVP